MISASGEILAKPLDEERAVSGSIFVTRIEAVEVGER